MTAAGREAIARALAASRAARACLGELDAALEGALEASLEEGLQQALHDPLPVDPHRADHRPGRRAKLAADPELRAFVEARFGTMTFDQIAAEVEAAFPPARRVRRSAIHQWWSLKHKRK